MAEGQTLSPQQMVQMNLLARQAVLQNGLEMTQQIYSAAIDPAAQPTINVPTRNVGLIKGFLVEVTGTVANTGMTTAATRTGFGSLNAISQFAFSDLNNNQRIQTTGRHIGLLNSARQGFGFGGAYSPNLPNGMGNNWTVQSAPASIAAGATGALSQIYYVPLAYGADDLRGAIYAGVVNATMNLQIGINANPVIASGDPLNAIYSGNTGGWSGDVTVTVYQVYIDQLPMGKGGPILPALDLNTIYDLKTSSVSGMSVGQDFAYSYSNFREFLSTFAIYDQNGTYNVGTDVNYWALQSANFTNIWKYSAKIAALFARQTFMADLPAGAYYFDHRRKPLLTNQYGNLELVLNPSSAAAQSQLVVSTEAFAQINQIVGAGSLPTG